MKLETWKDLSSTVQSCVTVLAVLIGGGWAYRSFVQQRQDHPRLQITQKIEHHRVSDKYNLLVVDEALANVGPVLLRLRRGEIRVIQVLPLPEIVKQKVATMSPQQMVAEPAPLQDSQEDPKTWAVLHWRQKEWAENELVIEPGETDQIHNEFVIPVDIRVVTVFSYIYNPTGVPRNLGWRATRMYDLTSRK